MPLNRRKARVLKKENEESEKEILWGNEKKS